MVIHPTAIVSPKAVLDPTVEVGPHAIIEEHVKIGAGTRVWANAYITGHTEIGRDNQIHMGAVIGHEPQDIKFDRKCRSYLRIGDRNIFREYCTVHRGTEPESATIIGNDCFLMAVSHVGHNCVIGHILRQIEGFLPRGKDVAAIEQFRQDNKLRIRIREQACHLVMVDSELAKNRLKLDKPHFHLKPHITNFTGVYRQSRYRVNENRRPVLVWHIPGLTRKLSSVRQYLHTYLW